MKDCNSTDYEPVIDVFPLYKILICPFYIKEWIIQVLIKLNVHKQYTQTDFSLQHSFLDVHAMLHKYIKTRNVQNHLRQCLYSNYNVSICWGLPKKLISYKIIFLNLAHLFYIYSWWDECRISKNHTIANSVEYFFISAMKFDYFPQL